MNARLLTIGAVLLLAACGDADDGTDPDDPALSGIRASVQASGRERDASVTVLVCADTPDANCQAEVVSPDGAVTFDSLAPGDYYAFLRDIAENCSVLGEWIRKVPLQDSTVSVGFDILCRGPGIVRVSVTTTGTNQPTGYTIFRETNCDHYYIPCDRRPLASSSSIDFSTFPGSQTLRLEDVPDNCAVIAPGNPATVTVIEDGVVELRFEVACE